MTDVLTKPDIARLAIPGAGVAHCRLPAWEAGDLLTTSATSSIGLSYTGQNCVVEVGGRTATREVGAASVVLIGGEPVSWLRVDQACELVEVSAETCLRRGIADELSTASEVDLAELSVSGDAIIWAIMARLRASARGAAESNSIEVESLVRHLYAHVYVTRFGGRLREKGNGALDPRRLARVVHFIDAHLGAALSLTVLAEVAALSVFHFQRSFRRATGSTPHEFVALRRAESAGRQLAAGKSASDIALSHRYASEAKMRAALRRYVGLGR